MKASRCSDAAIISLLINWFQPPAISHTQYSDQTIWYESTVYLDRTIMWSHVLKWPIERRALALNERGTDKAWTPPHTTRIYCYKLNDTVPQRDIHLTLSHSTFCLYLYGTKLILKLGVYAYLLLLKMIYFASVNEFRSLNWMTIYVL